MFFVSDGFNAFSDEFAHLCESSGDTAQLSSTPTSILGLGTLKIADASNDPALYAAPPSVTLQDAIGEGSVFPVQVLPYLFLGNRQNSSDVSCMREHNIRHVVNVTQDVDNHFEHSRDVSIRYLRIPIKDHLCEQLCDFFYQAIDFIGESQPHTHSDLDLPSLPSSIFPIVSFALRLAQIGYSDTR